MRLGGNAFVESTECVHYFLLFLRFVFNSNRNILFILLFYFIYCRQQSLEGTVDALSCVAPGMLHNTNTIQEFKNIDKRRVLRECAWQNLWLSIHSGQWLQRPSVLASFMLLSFADLKSHRFVYWFAWPAITSVKAHLRYSSQIRSTVEEQFDNSLDRCFDQHRKTCPVHHRGFFLLAVANKRNDSDRDTVSQQLQIFTVDRWEEAYALEQAETHKIYLTMADASALPQHPNWALRNFLLAASHTFGRAEFSVLCLRQSMAGRSDYWQHSLVMDVQVTGADVVMTHGTTVDMLSVAGWEKNASGKKAAPRIVDIGASMDPLKLAESSVTLNLSLMKWRMLPSLDLDTLSRTRCLLIGSGTLGCHVARNLIAWGFMNMTFVDRTRVSFSNPVRQTLFQYGDCLNGGKWKSEAAAEHMKLIYPQVNARHQNLDIPMPGHIVSNEQETLNNVNLMDKLINDHDVIFLLTDTRESRWLPTMLATMKRKIVINAALGFESYLVMRHGIDHNNDEEEDDLTAASSDNNSNGNGGFKLGCYFCNDVVAPVDSTKDRTLDQQCTVTRPGVSAIASALAVELLVSLLHHPRGAQAPAHEQSELGAVPHQIRGSLTTFNNAILTGHAYHQCTACSRSVVDAYRKDGFDFLKTVFNDPSVLEALTGLKELHERTQKMLDEIELIEDSNDDTDNDSDEFELI